MTLVLAADISAGDLPAFCFIRGILSQIRWWTLALLPQLTGGRVTSQSDLNLSCGVFFMSFYST